MAVFYNREKGKLGSLTGTIIHFPVQLIDEDPASSVNRELLPAGYLRCDGRVLTAVDYPMLATCLGTGTESRFRKTTQALTDDQFQLPDLRSKHIRATTSANIGVYNDLEVENDAERMELKTGVGLDVIMNVSSPFELTYNGSFYIPPQEEPMRGEPSFTVDTGGYTASAEVPANGFQPHMHRSTTSRARMKDRNGNDFGSLQYNSIRTKSSLDMCAWWENTKQMLCYWNITTLSQSGQQSDSNFTSYYEQYGLCWNACGQFYSQGYCLWPDTTTCPNVNNKTWNVRLSVYEECNRGKGSAGDTTTFGGPSEPAPLTSTNGITYQPTWTQACVCTLPILAWCPAALNGGDTNFINSSQLTTDFQGEKQLPFSPVDDLYQVGHGSVQNTTMQTGFYGNDGTHRHNMDFNTDIPHTFVMKTRASFARADAGLVSKITIDTNTAPKADKYIQPYIVTEYLIKT